MKKVVIISYFFPPANFVGAERTEAWYKYLPQFSIYPIIITRQWNNNQKDLVDKVIDNKLAINKDEKGEIHRVPYKENLRDKIANNYPKLRIIQKILTFSELVFSNFFIHALPYSNLYSYTADYLLKNPDINYVISSGRPFQTFFIGYLLKKKFPHIHWIPDYRDEWGSHQQKNKRSFLQQFIFNLEVSSEKRWTSNASFFISVSDYWVKSISQFITKKGVTIKNGYHPINQSLLTDNTQADTLCISYVGSLYATQKIDLFIAAVKAIILQNKITINVNFIGIDVDPIQKNRVENLIKGFENHFHIIHRMSKEELQQYYSKSDVLILTGFENIKGWYPVKLFDYYQKNIPILLCPSDKDVMEEFIIETNAGYIANSQEECEIIINEFIELKKQHRPIRKVINKEMGNHYSREYQTKLLAEMIHNIKE